MSVYWRAAAHTWRLGGTDYRISLGPYEERIRRFLRGETPFPDDMALSVRISGADDYLDMAYAPQSQRYSGFYVHRFLIPGVLFLLQVGGLVPRRSFEISTAPAPERYIAIHPKSEMDDLMGMAAVVQSTSSRGIP